jgi:two-component system response regulator RegA
MDFLLIDDDEAFASVLRRALIRRGYLARVAGNVEAALAALAESLPSHIVLDLNLAGESGLRLLPLLRERAPQALILVLTGYASIATAVDAIKLGAAQYLAKPAGVDDILAAFEQREPDLAQQAPEQPMSVRRLTWEHIQRVLAEHDGNVSATARALDMHRRTLQRMLAKKPANR